MKIVTFTINPSYSGVPQQQPQSGFIANKTSVGVNINFENDYEAVEFSIKFLKFIQDYNEAD